MKTLALVAFIYFAVAAAAAHRFSEYHEAGDREKLADFLKASIRWTFFPSLAATAVILALGKPFLMMFGPDFVAGYPAMFVVSIGCWRARRSGRSSASSPCRAPDRHGADLRGRLRDGGGALPSPHPALRHDGRGHRHCRRPGAGIDPAPVDHHGAARPVAAPVVQDRHDMMDLATAPAGRVDAPPLQPGTAPSGMAAMNIIWVPSAEWDALEPGWQALADAGEGAAFLFPGFALPARGIDGRASVPSW